MAKWVMNWRIKCLGFYAFRLFPPLRSISQRYLTRRYFEDLTPELLAALNFHVDNLKRLPPGATVMEFGAGRNLLCSLLLSHAGAGRVHAYDLNRLATVEQVNGVIAQLRERVGGEWPKLQSLDDLEKYRIEYHAPGDARRTNLPAADFICTTSTLEHIPAQSLREIHAECARLKPKLVSHIIDYHDHYASFDKANSRVNFYRYSERAWKFWNPSMHYQNRLRHSDQLALLAEAGFSPVEDRRLTETFDLTNVDDEFRRYSVEDLSTMNSFLLLQPAVRSP
jgi:hypothetical protein